LLAWLFLGVDLEVMFNELPAYPLQFGGSPCQYILIIPKEGEEVPFQVRGRSLVMQMV
jgi:hypothetical protein